MIIIERTWEESDQRGGGFLQKTERHCFSDNDVVGVEEFINEDKDHEDEWFSVKYKYIFNNTL